MVDLVLQIRKYKTKYDGTNVTNKVTAIKDTVMIPRYEAAISVITPDREVVRQVLEELGVDPGKHGIYYAFGLALSSAKFSHSGAVLAKIAAALKARFVGLGADPAVIDEITKAIIGTAPYY